VTVQNLTAQPHVGQGSCCIVVLPLILFAFYFFKKAFLSLLGVGNDGPVQVFCICSPTWTSRVSELCQFNSV